ncbi:uncharacterized protein LOC111130484 isoform X2 [Crassostrea virginica]|nr:transcriptional regulator Erg-like isoform X2 [Crassostrea virginica]
MMNEIFRIIEPQTDALISEASEPALNGHISPQDGQMGSYESSYQLSPALHDEASYDHHPDTAHFPSHYPPFETHPCYVTEDMTSHCSDVNVNQYYHASYPPCNTTLPAFQTSFQTPYYDTPEIKSEDDSEFIDQSSFMCRKGKRGAKNVLLWKFILEELRSGTESIRWVNLLTGTFRFVDTTDISRKWGQKKRKTDMNFEKLSRGIRHYYKSGFMSREDGTRLVYRFHWSKVPRAWRPREVQYEFDRRCRKQY